MANCPLGVPPAVHSFSLLFGLLIVPSFLNAQVILRDTVRISPVLPKSSSTTSTTSSTVFTTEPCQRVGYVLRDIEIPGPKGEVILVVGSQIDTVVSCPCQSLGCTYIGFSAVLIGPVPAGTPVTITASKCISRTQREELPVVLVPWETDPNRFTVVINGRGGGVLSFNPFTPGHPSVRITNPTRDTTILLTEENLPIINLREVHTPTAGQFVPSISWDPGPVIETANYFDLISDTLTIPAVVTAQNVCSVVRDTVLIRLIGKGLHHFRVSASPDTIEPGDMCTITAVAEDLNDIEVPLPANTLVILDVSPDNVGSIIDAAGDTMTGGVHVLEYQEVRGGQVRFQAFSTVTATQEVQFTVRKANDETKRGTASVVVLAPRLEIRITANPMQVQPAGTGGNSKTTITVEATLDGVPAPGIPIMLQARGIESSGGHDHHGNRPAGKFRNGSAEIEGVTDSNGQFETEYTASEFGGREKITESNSKEDTILQVLVDGLESLPEDPNYTQIGGTCNHHGPSDKNIPVSCKSPDNNHYATREVISSLASIAITWLQVFPFESHLAINDISLPNGGLFDVTGNWQPEHSEHREGKDADIRTEIPGDRQGIPVRDEAGNTIGNLVFEKICIEKGGRAKIHKKGTEQEHYHIDY